MPESHVSRGGRRGLRLLADLGAELRAARAAAGLTLDAVARAAGLSGGELRRIERGLAPWAELVTLCRIDSVVGLDVSLRAYPGPDPIRDAGHAALFRAFRALLGPGIRLRAEVPVEPAHGLRAWDATLDDRSRLAAAELEMRLTDSQSLLRRISLKRRDAGVDVVILVLADTRANRLAFRATEAQLRTEFPLDSLEIRRSLTRGRVPEVSGVLLVEPDRSRTMVGERTGSGRLRST